jgi:hypothetical protein
MSARVVRCSRKKALETARAEIERINRDGGEAGHQLAVLEDSVAELWWAWIVPFSTIEYARTRDLAYSLLGAGPMLVDKFNGELLHTGSRFDAIVRHIERQRGYRSWWRFW